MILIFVLGGEHVIAVSQSTLELPLSLLYWLFLNWFWVGTITYPKEDLMWVESGETELRNGEKTKQPSLVVLFRS